MTDDELLARLAETPVDDWTVEEVEELRARLPQSPALREAMHEYLLTETVLSAGLTKPRVSAEQILARYDAERRSKIGRRGGLWAALIFLVPALSAGVWLWTMREPPGAEVAGVDPTKQPLWPTATASAGGAPRPTPSVRASASPSATPSATAEPKVEPAPVEPPAVKPSEAEPWEPMLAKAPRPLNELAFDDRRLSHDESVLLKWWDTLGGQQRRVESREDVGIVLDGTFRLRAPWTADSVLTLWLRDTSFGRDGASQLSLLLWHGERGVVLQHRRQPYEHWTAYACTKQTNDPQPDLMHYAAGDDDRNRRTGYGPIDLSYRDGRVYVSRGDIVLLSAPLAGMPDAVYLDGRTKIKAMGVARSTGVPDAWLPQPIATWSDYTAATEPLTVLPDGAKFERLGASGLALSATTTTTEARVALPITRPGFHEAILEIESASPGTGLFWGDATGKPKYAYSIVNDARSGRPLLIAANDRREADPRYRHDPKQIAPPLVGFPLYLKLVSTLGSIRCYASTDGLSWGRILDPRRDSNGIVGSIGVYVAPGKDPRSIRVKNISFRTIFTYDDKLAGELPKPPLEWDYARWLLQAMDGTESDEVRYHRLMKSLTLGLPLELAKRVTYELAAIPCGDLPPGVPKTVQYDLDYVGRLASIVDAWDPNVATLWTRRLGRSTEYVVDRSDAVARDPRIHAPFSSVRKALVFDAPPSPGRSWSMPPDALRREILGMVRDGDWDALDRQTRVWHRFGGTDEHREIGHSWSPHVPNRAEIMKLVDWAAALAARNRDDDEGAARNPFRREWRHPLIEQFGKEGYNVLAELGTALEEKAYADACRIISGVTAAQAVGLLPNAHDPDLLTALPGSVALAMKSHPELRAAMQRDYGELALLRLKQAATDGDVAAVRAITTQFYGTTAAAQAQMWLGDRALAQGDAARAEGHYHAALREGSPAEAGAIEARLRLAVAWQGRDHGTPPTGNVRLGDSVLSPTEFERVVSTLRNRAEAPSASSRVVAPQVGPFAAKTWPAATSYKLNKWADLDGDVGIKSEPPKKNVDYHADQIAVVFAAGRMLVSNRFQVAAYDLKDGKRVWRTGLGSEQGRTFEWAGMPMTPLPVDDRIFVRRLTSKGPELACLNQSDGRLLWRTPRGEIVASDPLLVGDRLLAVTLSVPQVDVLELSLTMYDARTGRMLRTRPIGLVRDYWKREVPCYLVAAEEMFVVSAAACLIGCDADGEPRWTRRLTYVPPSIDVFCGPTKPEPPTVAGDRVTVAQPGVPFRYVIDVRSGSLLEQSLELREEEVFPSRETLDTQPALVVADGRRLELVRRRFTDKLTRNEIRWQNAADAEISHTWAAPWSPTPRGAGPLVVHDGRAWVFLADEQRLGTRRITELVPDGAPQTADAATMPDPAAAPWLTSTMSTALEDMELLSREWRLFSPRQTYLDDRTFAGVKLFLEDDCVLTYPSRDCPVYWVRQAALPADRDAVLHLQTAVAEGGTWKLTVQVGRDVVFEKIYTDPKVGQWFDERIDLKKYRGQTVRLAVGCDVDGKKKTFVAWKRMDVE
jgi:hypothetical protein